MDDVMQFIELLKGLGDDVALACTRGNCYRLHLVIAKAFRDAQPYMNHEQDYVVTRVGNDLYDIHGRIGSIVGRHAEPYHLMTEDERKVAEEWLATGCEPLPVFSGLS